MIAGHLQEKKGYYHMVLECKDSNGKRKNKWISTGLKVKGNKKRAEEMLIAVRREYDKEQPQQDGENPILFADYMMEWLETIRCRVTATTYGSYQMVIGRIIAPYFRERNIKLVDLQANDIQDYYKYLMNERGVSANTAIHHHANIRKALKYAVQTDLILTNPADKVDRPKKETFIGNFLTAEEINNLFKMVCGDKLEFAVVSAACYGLRRSEIVGLKWGAIDFVNKTITIQHTVTQAVIDGRLQEVVRNRTKNQSSRRTLPLIPQFESLLLKLKEKQAYYQQICKSSYNRDFLDYIFVDEMGNRFKPDFITHGFPQFLKKNGLKLVRFHDLRHSCASILLANGVSMKEIQEWLGHSNYSTTANTYSHLEYRAKVIASEKMNSCLSFGDSTARLEQPKRP